MANYIYLDKDAAWDALEEAVDSKSSPWKWGHTETHVFLHSDGCHYRFTQTFHRDDGDQTLYPISAVQVRPVEVTTTMWKIVEDATKGKPNK